MPDDTRVVGLFPPVGLLSRGTDNAREYLANVGEAGIDYVCCGDHVSFFGGLGFDGLVQATALAMLHPTLPVAPGRLVLGVGVGGDDRHEILVSGVDPATRGRRMDECLAIVRQLLDGSAVSVHSVLFDLDEAVIAPTPAVPIPIVVGGRSDAAIRRAGRLGDGWLGIWNSPKRFASATRLAEEEAAGAGRPRPARHAMQVWCGLADTKHAARACLAPAMEAFYQLPFEKFERYCPYGTAEDVAEFLTPYVDAGCTEFNLIPQSGDHAQAVAGVAAVKRLLAQA